MSKVVVLGGGVSGLTSALCLLAQFKDTIEELTVLASEYPGDYHAPDYTSPWAGANWCSFVRDGDKLQIQRDKLTYDVLLQLADREQSCGVKKYCLKTFMSRNSAVPWYIKDGFVKGLKELSNEEVKSRKLDPSQVRGFEFTTVSINPTRYNNYLISQIVKAGGAVRRVKRLDTIDQVVDVMGYVPSLVVNCTGVNAGKLLREVDPNEQDRVYPVKGHILQIYEDLPYQVIIEDLPKEDNALPNQFLNVFPRPEGGCIVGGLAAKGDYSKDIDPELSSSILRVMKRHIPELSTATVYNSYVAFRPGRKGGVRIDFSEYPLAKHVSTLKVVHNYGIGGSGYQSSYGIAMEVCGYAERAFLQRPKCPFKL
ncbi:hypothetical protein ZYGR_0E00840 [Zygosaccharomyces rouxii]|uniref:ZYRO0B01892p n=2 Tax=Zygosaccharomyces rouxii TaxID=4956 RepID=C5DQP2_ZYGRC|nr:uncharacterized protein ZYRO0B01892g [Zygosaccharomyces rouxii]KAH9200347.1 FAD dependent oxidoreductase [Zygosaccharomyces rouxii]GAV47070.1 hypothetical protein ZYGR_0E00840 [Zygosaccharomyces rouxii]CAR26103.1 ZYRO0B01892p [Zygosaccharomyces rouxii]